MNTAKILKYVWPFSNIAHERVKEICCFLFKEKEKKVEHLHDTFYCNLHKNPKLTTKMKATLSHALEENKDALLENIRVKRDEMQKTKHEIKKLQEVLSKSIEWFQQFAAFFSADRVNNKPDSIDERLQIFQAINFLYSLINFLFKIKGNRLFNYGELAIISTILVSEYNLVVFVLYFRYAANPVIRFLYFTHFYFCSFNAICFKNHLL